MKSIRIRIFAPLLILSLILLVMVLPLTANAATTGTITASANHVDEGSTISLTTNMTGTVTWTSSSTSIATVSSTGKVTGKLAGQVTITASCSGYTDASITIWVTVPDGLYYIKNASSSLCLQNSSTGTALYTKNTGSTTRIPQLWKITYISSGYYAVRPMQDTSKAIKIDSSNYVVSSDTSATDSSLASTYRWMIKRNSFGYYFQQAGRQRF